jgi:hypothetical protein
VAVRSSMPNSSASSRVSTTAAQFTATNGPAAAQLVNLARHQLLAGSTLSSLERCSPARQWDGGVAGGSCGCATSNPAPTSHRYRKKALIELAVAGRESSDPTPVRGRCYGGPCRSRPALTGGEWSEASVRSTSMVTVSGARCMGRRTGFARTPDWGVV